MPTLNRRDSLLCHFFTTEEEFSAFTFQDNQLAALETELTIATQLALSEVDPKLSPEQQLTIFHFNRGRIAAITYLLARHHNYIDAKIAELSEARPVGTL